MQKRAFSVRLLSALPILLLLVQLGWTGSLRAGVISMTTSKRIGEKITMTLRGKLQIVGLSGKYVDGQPVEYIVNARTIRIEGDVEMVNCDECGLTALDASTAPTLGFLSCAYNKLTQLNVHGCAQLKWLICNDNQLIRLNLTGCTRLAYLYCQRNRLMDLDLRPCRNLGGLACANNQLRRLDLSSFQSLEFLSCRGNQLTEVNVRRCYALSSFDCGENRLTELDIETNYRLERFSCGRNEIARLKMTRHPALKIFDCSHNRLTEFNVQRCPRLTHLWCNANLLTQLDLSRNSRLTMLSCQGNQLTELNLSACPEMSDLCCAQNRIQHEAMGRIVNTLLSTGVAKGDFYPVDLQQGQDRNVCLVGDVQSLVQHGWTVYNLNGGVKHRIPFGGYSKPRYTVSYNRPRNGQLQLFAYGKPIDNDAQLEEGTPIVVRATPKTGYRTIQLQINGLNRIGEQHDGTLNLQLDGNTHFDASFEPKYTGQMTGVEDGNLASIGVMAYPNPFAETLHLSGLYKGDVLTLHAIDGVLVHKSVARWDGEMSLSLGTLPPGSYVLQLERQGTRIAHCLVKR